MKASTASIKLVLPAADDDCTSTASGPASRRETHARYAVSLLVASPTRPQASKSAAMRCKRFGAFSHASAVSCSASLIDGTTCLGALASRSRCSMACSTASSTRPSSRNSSRCNASASRPPSSAAACAAKTARERALYKSTLSTCSAATGRRSSTACCTRTLSLRLAPGCTFGTPRTAHVRAPHTRRSTSPSTSACDSSDASAGVAGMATTAGVVTGGSTDAGDAGSAAKEEGVSSFAAVASVGVLVWPTVRAGASPLPSHCALRTNRARLLAAGCTFSAYSFASMPRGNCTR